MSEKKPIKPSRPATEGVIKQSQEKPAPKTPSNAVKPPPSAKPSDK